MATFVLSVDAGATLSTLNPDGSVYKDITFDASKNRIGEYKKWVQNFTVSGGNNLNNKMISFSPELFLTSARISYAPGQIPSECYSYLNNSASTPGTYTMYLSSIFPYLPGLIKNFKAEITITNSTTFSIALYYYQVYDLSDFLNSSIEDNHSKLLKYQVQDPSELVLSNPSVYNTLGIGPISYLIVYDTSDFSTYASSITNFTNYGAGFYGKNVYQTAPFFTNPLWNLYDASLSPISKLLISQDTKVKFTVNTAGSRIDKILIWAIRTDTQDNTIDFYANYEASFTAITTLGSGTLDNKIKAPSQAPTLSIGNTWDCFFNIDKTKIAVGQLYRFIAIVYLEEYGAYNVNSFISDEYTVELPKFTGDGYSFGAKLNDYINDYTGNDLTCVIEERLKSTTILDYSYTAFKTDIFNRLGIVLTNNDIRRYLTKITFEIYEEIGNTIQYLQRDVVYKTGPTTYSTPSNCTLDFSGDVLTMEFSFRNRYEIATANIETVIAGIPLTTANSNQYWGGKQLSIKTSIELLYDNYTIPFSDIIEFNQYIEVKDYDTVNLLIKNQDGSAIPNFYLNTSAPALEGILGLTNPENYKLLTTAEVAPGSVGSIEENEEFIGLLPQLDSTKFNNQEINYSDSTATKGKFNLNVNDFLLNLPYKISVLAKNVNGSVINPSLSRITEDSILRNLETFDFRIIE